MRRAILLTLLAVAGFAGTAALFRPLLPWPIEYGLQAKWDHFEAHRDEYDAVFLGSSRVFRGVNTPLIEAELAERGIRFHAFNFGVAGMLAYEQDHLLQRILELEPERLKWAILEGGRWTPYFSHEFLTYSSRSVFWHTPDETLEVLDAVRLLDAPLGEKLRMAGVHVGLMLRNLTSYGQGHVLAERVFRTPEARARYARTQEILREQDGFEAADQHTLREFAPGREELLANREAYDERVAAIEAETAEAPDPATVSRLAVRRQHELCRRHGVELLYVIQPGYEGAPERVFLHEAGDIERLLDFNRPSEYPELFRLENRYDEKHFNARGADVFSRELARVLADELREGHD